MPSVSQARVALITGGGSGMGLAVSHHLASQGWKVSIADLNVKSGEAVAKEIDGIFTKVDVTKYEDQVACFQKTWEEYGRLDFVYANAGIIDTIPWYDEQKSLPPPKPTLLVQDVCLTGVEYSAYLAMHYMRRNKVKGGSLVMTSSAAGIYPSYLLPIYTAAKHGVVGFMRAMAPILAKENIRVNCTLPGAVHTNLCKEEVWNGFPEDQFTSTKNIVDAVMRLVNDEKLTGKALEVSKDKWYYREQLEFCDEAQKAVMGAIAES